MSNFIRHGNAADAWWEPVGRPGFVLFASGPCFAKDRHAALGNILITIWNGGGHGQGLAENIRLQPHAKNGLATRK